jgi:hypothetical protein
MAVDGLDPSCRVYSLCARSLLANPKILAMGSMLAVAIGVFKVGFATGIRFPNSDTSSASQC